MTGNANGEEDGDINKVMKQLEQQALDDQDKEEDGEDGLFFFFLCHAQFIVLLWFLGILCQALHLIDQLFSV